MFGWTRSIRLSASGIAMTVAALAAVPVAAQVNDNWADATIIASLPYSDAITTSAATTEASDPQSICFVGANSSVGRGSVWYRYTTGATAEYLNLSSQGSTYDSVIQVFTGTPGTFRQVLGGCNDDGVGTTFQSRVAGLRLAPSTAYSIEVISHGSVTFGGSLQFAATAAPQYLVTRMDDPNPALSDCLPGNCTLRSAIKSSNTTPGAVIIPAGTYAIALGSSGEDANGGGDFDIKSGMGIYGAGPDLTFIDALHVDRAFDIDPSGGSASGRVTAIIGDLAIRNGGGPSFFGDGGAIRAYDSSGGNLSNDFVALQRVRISDSRSQLNGGAMALSARGMMEDSEFRDNYANSTGGALTLGPSFGGGDTTIQIVGSTIANNQSPSSFSGGGGIKSTARLRIANSTIVGNSTGYHGGGIYLTGTGNADLRSTTIASNIANTGGFGNGGGLRIDGGTVNLINTLLANNTLASASGSTDDCMAGGGSLTASFSVLRNASGCSFTGSGNLSGVDPLLAAALADNGGTTRTLALLDGSPAIDAGNPGGCTDSLGLNLDYDQRGSGFPRVDGFACDIGAYEKAGLPAPAMPVLAQASDSGLSNSDGITNINQPHILGTCIDNDTMQLAVDGNLIAPAVVCSASAFDIVPSVALVDGVRAITVIATRGSIVSPSSPALSITIDTQAPALPTIDGPTGLVGNPVTFSGNAEAMAQVSVREAAQNLCTTVALADTSWACSAQIIGGGQHSVVAVATDIAGNISGDSAASEINVDQIFANGFDD